MLLEYSDFWMNSPITESFLSLALSWGHSPSWGLLIVNASDWLKEARLVTLFRLFPEKLSKFPYKDTLDS